MRIRIIEDYENDMKTAINDADISLPKEMID
jgi:hypothetical protein